ncbi:MAG: pyridoxal phosphate-dependent aminotransferase [Fimbriimonas sp.]
MNTLSLSARAELLKPSPTLSITAKANQMKADGLDVVSLAAGEPDFSTPEPICKAAIQAIEQGFTRYTPSSGTKDLKEAIAGKLERENNLAYKPDQIVVSCGAKHSVYNALQVLVNPGDEVILLAPYWMTYAEQVILAGGTPVQIATEAENDFVPSYDQLKEAISPKTKVLILNAPGNPTGAILPRENLKQIAALAIRHGFWVVADEIYERLVYDGFKQDSIASLGRDIMDQTVTIGGCSKSYAMTGWRIGFAAAPVPVAKAMANLQDQVTSNPTSFAQKGATAAFNLPPDAIEAMRAEFEARRNLIVGLLRDIEGVNVRKPGGAFYVFPDVSAFLGPDMPSDIQLAEHLLEEAQVATVPGSVFMGKGHLRLSYAASRHDIERGVARIADVLGKRRQ